MTVTRAAFTAAVLAVSALLLAPSAATARPAAERGHGVAAGCVGTLYAVSLGDPLSRRHPSGSLVLFDAVTGKRKGAPKQLGLEPGSMAFSPDNATVYVTNNGSDDVSEYSTVTGERTAVIPVGDLPTNIAMNPNGRYVYVTNTKGASVSVIDTATRAVVDVPVAVGPYGLAVAPDGSALYVATYKGATTITAYSLSDAGATLTATGSPIPVGTSVRGMKVSPDGAELLATVYGAKATSRGALWVIDTAGFTVSSRVEVGASPTRVVFNAAGTQAWVTNFVSGTVSVIDLVTDTVVRTIKVGKGAFGVSFDAAGRTVFVASSVTGTISRIDAVTYRVGHHRARMLLPDNVAVCGAAPSMQG